MVRINLLPWREARRKQRGKEFAAMMAAAVAGGLLLSILFWVYLNGQIAGQGDRNAFLDGEIKKVEAQIKDIEQLKAKKEALLSRTKVIEELQANRYQMVHLFDALMRTVPEGLVLTGLKQDGEQLTLEGRAQSNARVATYMRNLESAGWVKNPDVSVIEATPAQPTPGQPAAAPVSGVSAVVDNSAASLPYMFTMRVTLANPAEPRDPNAPPTPDPVVIQPAAPPTAIVPLPAPAEAAAPQPAPPTGVVVPDPPKPAAQDGDR